MWGIFCIFVHVPHESAAEMILEAAILTKMQVSIGFITVHGHSEDHIAPYTDIEFQRRKKMQDVPLTHWGRDKMAASSQTTFSIFLWICARTSWLTLA